MKSLVKLASFEDCIKEVDTLIQLYMYNNGYHPQSLECVSVFIKISIMVCVFLLARSLNMPLQQKTVLVFRNYVNGFLDSHIILVVLSPYMFFRGPE